MWSSPYQDNSCHIREFYHILEIDLPWWSNSQSRNWCWTFIQPGLDLSIRNAVKEVLVVGRDVVKFFFSCYRYEKYSKTLDSLDKKSVGRIYLYCKLFSVSTFVYFVKLWGKYLNSSSDFNDLCYMRLY